MKPNEHSLLVRLLPYAVDFAVMALAYTVAYALRFNFDVPAQNVYEAWRAFPVVVAVQFLALRAFGCQRIVWQFVTARDVLGFLYAAAATVSAFVLLRFVLPGQRTLRPPFSIALLNGALFAGGTLLARVLWRLLREGRLPAPGGAARRVLLVGAGSTGNAVARELRQHRTGGMEVVGFLDDDPVKQGTVIQGVPVRGRIAELARTIADLRVQEVIVAMIAAPRAVVRDVVHTCETADVPMRIAPSYSEILDGSLSVSRLREVDIADLLGREEVDFGGGADLARFVGGRRVLVTGAGGSIGAELARQVARLGPERLVLVERNEYALYEIDRALREAGHGAPVASCLADIGDAARMQALLAAERPQIVLHAAAHKHVPLLEGNVAEAVRNNVLATRALGELARQHGVETFILLSTDKAVRASSVMGVTKRLAELALQDLQAPGGTRFAAVRFGNVLGASGSVVPLFREQIRRGGPVTVTHPDMRRYFMTVPEAARLVLLAASLAAGGEVFILDMGTPVRIVELAEEMIRLSGLRPYEDVPIQFTGVRPGEKLFEELSTDEENAVRTRHPRIFIGRIPARGASEVAGLLESLRGLCDRDAPPGDFRTALRAALPEASL
jgi:FlaA1/EpsC-like NDP-sugar epimerase